jgi:hypothetical protein
MMNETFRPRSNFAWAATSYILIVLFAINTLWVVEDNLQIIRDLIVCVVLCAVVYIFWIKPKLVLGADVIQVVNPFRTESIAYADVIDLETKWSLAILHAGGKTRVWVAPASGKQRWVAEKKFGWISGNSAGSGSKHDGMESMSASLDSLSGQAAYIIRERMKRSH